MILTIYFFIGFLPLLLNMHISKILEGGRRVRNNVLAWMTPVT
jgi:hypothetical protein